MYMNRKTKTILIVVAFIIVFALLIAIFSRLNGMESTRNLTSSNYSIASISETTGKTIESKQNLATKNMYKLDGAEIKLEDDATVSYKIFFYDTDSEYISASDILTENFDNTEAPETAVYFRVVITPAQVDGENVELSVFNMSKYASQLLITVNK